MRLRFGPACAAALFSLSLSPLIAQTNPELVTPPELRKPLAAGEADLILGGYQILRLRGAAGGLAPDQRVAAITDRLTPLLGVPNILPSDVVVYLPPPKSRYNRYPVIYVMGRRVITVDPATVKAAGGNKTPLQTAMVWAARLQQVLPRVNWRPSNAAEMVIPAAPLLTVTPDFALVDPGPEPVMLRGKVILTLRGPQPGGLTAAERADMLAARLAHLARSDAAAVPDAVQVTESPTGAASLYLAGTIVVSVTARDAQAAGFAEPVQLAASWAKNLRAVLTPPAVPPAPVFVPPAVGS